MATDTERATGPIAPPATGSATVVTGRAAGGHHPIPAEDAAANDRAISGLDALELGGDGPARSAARRLWSQAWPKLGAVAIAVLAWQVVVWSGWRAPYLLPGPATVWTSLRELVVTAQFWHAVETTMRRAVVGYALAMVLGVALGLVVARVKVVRAAIGSLVTGLQTMPSIAWFPLAILLFQLSEGAIMFVVVLGAAPSIAAGLISGIDNVPPILLRAGHVLGARRLSLMRSVVLPAALPTFVAGMRQGWAFAWRSLMAGELLVLIPHRPSIGALLDGDRQLSDAPGLLSVMVVILIIGLVIDGLFNRLDRSVRRRRGLLVET